MTPHARQRHLEIDLLRTIAILGMIAHHLCFDLYQFYDSGVHPWQGMWYVVARSTSSLFLLLVGVSFAISSARGGNTWSKALKRTAKILACALMINAITYMLDPEQFIRFGILHCIGVSALLLPLLRPLRLWTIPLGAAVIAGGLAMKNTIVGTSLLIPLGFIPRDFHTFDYFPLLPWFGVILLGYGLGYAWYIRRPTSPLPHPPLLQSLTWPGRHALPLYLLHQPVMLAMLWIIMG